MTLRLYPSMPKCSKAHLFHKREETLLMVTDEVSDFLYGLVRLTKPIHCVETGTHYGDSAQKIGMALQANGLGHLHTCDIDGGSMEKIGSRINGLPVTFHAMRGEELLKAQEQPMDFVFIDSGDPNVRAIELALIGDHNVSPLGIVAMHDICVDYENMYEIFIERGWPHLVFPSIVGVAIFQRPEKG